MESWAEFKKGLEKIAETNAAYQKANDDRIKAIESGDTAKAATLDEKMTKIDADMKKAMDAKQAFEIELQHAQERIEKLEAGSKNPNFGKIETAEKSYREVWEKALRGQFQDSDVCGQVKRAERELLDLKDITTTTGAAGGYAVPEEISRAIEKLEAKFSPIRGLVKVVQVGTSDYKELVNLRGTTGGWVGETGTRSATATPTLREVTPTHGELYAYPQASEWSLDDMFFNVEAWLTEEVAETFAIEEELSFLTGDGTNQLTGILNSTPTAVADDATTPRAAAVYEYVDSAASPDAILPDPLIDLTYRVNSRYRAGAGFIMNSNSMAAVRKLKDTTNQYLWQPGLQLGQPNTLLGYGVSAMEQMPDVGANTFPIAFGNWRRAYVLVDRVGTRITRDEITNPGFVKYYVRRREGGIPLNNNAAKFLRTS